MILSPYGEGYCTVCRFIEPLGPDGLIEEHTRIGSAVLYVPARERCKGSGSRPPKRTPRTSGKNRFRVRTPKMECPACRQEVKIMSFADGQYYARHNRRFLPGECRNSQTPVRPAA